MVRLPISTLINGLADKLGIRTWYQGEDGFGGEWMLDPKHYEAIRQFREQAYEDGWADGKSYRKQCDSEVRG